MNAARIGALVGLELRQRLRSVGWYVLLGVFFLLLMGVTWFSFLSFSFQTVPGAGVYSVVVCFVLLLVVLVTPTLSGNAINGDRDAATLAPVQATLATSVEIIVAKLLAAWLTGLVFLLVAVPFLLVAMLAGAVAPSTLVVSLLVLIVETGIIAAIGVGLSAVIARPLFSVAATYLVVAGLTLGTLIAFALGGSALRTETTVMTRDVDYQAIEECLGGMPQPQPPQPPSQPGGAYQCADGSELDPQQCGEWYERHQEVPRFDRVWWLLAVNPFVILGDAIPAEFDANGDPADMFGQLQLGVRAAQVAPETEQRDDYCTSYLMTEPDRETPEEIVAGSTPSWFVGLAIQIVLAGGLMAWGWSRTRTPARRLPPGTRIA